MCIWLALSFLPPRYGGVHHLPSTQPAGPALQAFSAPLGHRCTFLVRALAGGNSIWPASVGKGDWWHLISIMYGDIMWHLWVWDILHLQEWIVRTFFHSHDLGIVWEHLNNSSWYILWWIVKNIIASIPGALDSETRWVSVIVSVRRWFCCALCVCVNLYSHAHAIPGWGCPRVGRFRRCSRVLEGP